MINRKPQWYNVTTCFTVKHSEGESQINRIVGIQIGCWFIGGLRGVYIKGTLPREEECTQYTKKEQKS